jgi:hypothetical protein
MAITHLTVKRALAMTLDPERQVISKTVILAAVW